MMVIFPSLSRGARGLFLAAIAAWLCLLAPGSALAQLAAAAPEQGSNFFSLSLAESLGIDQELVTGIFLGIITASFIYLLSTWAVIRDRSQVFLVLMLLCMLVHVVAANGYNAGNQAHPVISLFLMKGALLLFYLSSAIFTFQYLELDVSQSRFRFVLYGLMAVLVLALVIAAVDIGFISRVLPWISLAALLVIICAGCLSLANRAGSAGLLLLAFSVILLGQLHTLPFAWKNSGLPIFGGDVTAVTFVLCAMMFAVVTATQFARRQEKKEFELARSNERFQMAALGSNEGLYDWDMARSEGYFSQRLRYIFGTNLGGHKGDNVFRAWFGLIHREDRKQVRKNLFAFLRDIDRTTLTLEYRIARIDGKILWLTSTVVAVRNKTTGRVLRLVGSVGDITEKKRAEVRLKASENRFRSIAEAHPVPVMIATIREGEVVYASQGTEKFLRTSLPHLIGKGLDGFFAKSAERTEIMQEVRKHGRVDLREVVMRRSDKTAFSAAISARLIDYERRPCAVLGFYDLTERKTAETRIKETEAALQQSEKLAALGGLLAGVAHELNNPLSVIVGQAVLMQESTKEEKIVQRADKIQKAGERCSRIVRSFLALARRKPSERGMVSINEVIENSLELLAFQLRTDNVELVRKLAANLPSVMADSDQMTQVITNLVINAKHALQDNNGGRSITVETRLVPGVKDLAESTIHVSVTDNGPGVPHDIITRIFEPFFTTKPAGTGTGVGLSLCHNIVETHGGRIWVENAPGGGACFVFTLPASVATMANANLDAVTKNSDLSVPPQRILIVDDEIELAQTMADILAPYGHTTVLAHNGRVALDLLERDRFDIIISDLRMPVLDGPGMYRTLEKARSPYLSRIIFVTGDTLSEPVRDFLSEYALDVIEKPYTPEDVRKAIAALVNTGGQRAGKSSGTQEKNTPHATAP